MANGWWPWFGLVLRGHPGLLKGRTVVRFRFGWRNVADRLVVVLTLVAHQATDRAGLSPAASVGIGLAVQCFAGVLSLLGAYFLARRW